MQNEIGEEIIYNGLPLNDIFGWMENPNNRPRSLEELMGTELVTVT